MSEQKTTTLYINEVKYTLKSNDQSDGWQPACAGHETMLVAIRCKETQWVGTQKLCRDNEQAAARVALYNTDVRIMKRTIIEEIVEEAERFVLAK